MAIPLGYSRTMATIYSAAGNNILKSIRRRYYRQDKMRLWIAQNQKCKWCGKACLQSGPGSSPDEFTIDHVIPLHCQGTNHWKNLVGACFACNKQRSKNWMEINIQQFALEK